MATNCPLARAVGDALLQRGGASAALITHSPNEDTTPVLTRVSAVRLHSWISASVTAITATAPDFGRSSPVLALALPACSIEESAWMLLVASQPRWMFVPIDVRAPNAQLCETIASCGADGLVTWDASGLAIDGSTATPLPALYESSVNMHFHRLHIATKSPRCWRSDPLLRGLYVIPTSGTTGQAKGVVGTRVGALERVNWSQNTLPLDNQRDAVLRATRLSFVDAVAEILSACLGGVPLVHLQFHSRDDTSPSRVDSIVLHSPRVFVDAIAQSQITRFTVVPSVLRVLLHCISALVVDGDRQRLSSLQIVLVSGEALPLDVVDEFFRLLPHVVLVNLYGSTEVSGDVTWKMLQAPPSKVQRERWRRLGVPIGSVPLRVIGDSTRIRLERDGSDTPMLPESQSSDIWVRGGAVAAGYLVEKQLVRPPDKWTRDSDGIEWFRMGDLCRIIDGELFLCGRKDRQVKIRGNRLQLEDIERGLKQAIQQEPTLSDVTDVVVSTAVPMSPTVGQYQDSLAAFLLVRGDQTEGRGHRCDHCQFIEIDGVTMRGVMERVVAQFGELFVPRTTTAIAVADVPRRGSGKVDVSRLGEMFRQHLNDGSRSLDMTQPPSMPLASTMTTALALVETVLGLSHGLVDSQLRESTWLQLGGDSLQAAMLSWELDRHLKQSIPAHDILEMKINELLKRVSSKKRRLEDSNDAHSSVKVSRRVMIQPRMKHDLDDARSACSLPTWVWYSRYNQSSLQPASQVSISPTGSHCLPATAKISLKLIAQTDLRKCIDASPLIVRRRSENGNLDSKLMVLIGSHAGKFVCLKIDLVTYESCELWTKHLDDRIEATATFSVENGLVYVGTYSGRLYALDIETGDVAWQFQARDMIKSSALVVESLALVIVGAYDQHLYGLDIASGAVVWTKELPGSVFSTPLFVSSTHQLVVATTSGTVIAGQLQTRDGLRALWITKLPAPVFASLVRTKCDINGNAQVLVGCADGVVYALNLATGSTKWSFRTLKPIFCTPCVYEMANNAGNLAAIVGSHDGKLRKISLTDGARLWEADASESSGNSAIFASSCVTVLRRNQEQDECLTVVCAATTGGHLWFLDETTGREILWTCDMTEEMGEIFSSPVVVEDVCFVGSRSNQLLVFQLEIDCP